MGGYQRDGWLTERWVAIYRDGWLTERWVANREMGGYREMDG
jgi:hypothetical protein